MTLNSGFIQVGFKMFIGVTASVTNWNAEGTCCSIVLEDNPLVDFVELPDTYQGLHYCNILSGVIRGALDMVSFYFYFLPHFTYHLYFIKLPFINFLISSSCFQNLTN